MTLDLEKFAFSEGVTPLNAAELNGRFYALVRRLHALETIKIDWQGAIAELQNYGLERINNVLYPLLDELKIDLASVIEGGRKNLDSIASEYSSLREEFVNLMVNIAPEIEELKADISALNTAIGAEVAERKDMQSKLHPIGDIRSWGFKAQDLPWGWYFCNWQPMIFDSPPGQALFGLPEDYKSAFNIVVEEDEEGKRIRTPNMFYIDGRGVLYSLWR